MSFYSFGFAVFMIAFFYIYWAIPSKYRWILILAGNTVFYLSFGVKSIVWVVLTTLVSYGAAFLIERTQKGKKTLLTVASVIVCLAPLLIFKYTNFAISTFVDISKVFGFDKDAKLIKLAVPVGISFYTFQILGYLIDVYRGKYPAFRHLGKYAVFVTFFPNIVSGPIERADHFMPQIDSTGKFDYDKSVYGLRLFLLGLIKKVVIANFFCEVVNNVWNYLDKCYGLAIIVVIVLYTFQIYLDFSGYSDMARGLARMLGFDLLINFKQPYLASSVKEFWGRWHISLSTWFRDYLYITLGGNRKGTFRRYLNIVITFLVSGLWHGADLSFIVWGGIHGLCQVVEYIIEKAIKGKNASKEKKEEKKFVRILKICITFFIVMIAWVFFRADSISDALLAFSKISLEGGIFLTCGMLCISKFQIVEIIVMLIAIVLYDIFSEKYDLVEKFGKLKWPFRWLFYLIVGTGAVIFALHSGVSADFIYMKF